MTVFRPAIACLMVFAGSGLRPDAANNRGSQPDFAALVEQYRTGNADAAVADLATWPDVSVTRESERVITSPLAGDPWHWAALAMLHTEAGIYQGRLGALISGRVGLPAPDQAIPAREIEVHFRQATVLIESLFVPASQDPALAMTLRDWHIFVSGLAIDANAGELSPGMLASKRFPADSASWLLSGSVIEPTVIIASAANGFAYYHGFISERSARAIREGRKPDTFTRNAQGQMIDRAQVQLAEHAFNRALELNPRQVEARLRLGRVLLLADRRSEAIAALTQVTAEASGKDLGFSGYLAWLWLGQVHEDDRLFAEAARHYKRALEIRPASRSARIALAAVQARAAETLSAWKLAGSVLDAPAHLGEADPVTLYPRAQLWRHNDLRTALRAKVSR